MKNKKDKINVNGVKNKGKKLWKEFKAFISKGSVLDLAIGVVIGGAFSSIVTSVVNVLLSLCTWGVPGGINGLVTPLPALNDTQKGIAGIGQSFDVSKIKEMTEIYAQSKSIAITDANYAQMESALTSKYTLYGTTYYYNGTAIINWGSIINAFISFIIIALVLFTIIKVSAVVKAKKAEIDAKMLEQYYKSHPEERPAPVEPGVPQPTQIELLTQIRDLLKSEKEKK